MALTRREFLKLSAGAAAAAAAMPLSRAAWARPRLFAGAGSIAGTTLEQTIVKGPLLRNGTKSGYYRLAAGPGEPHILRGELGGSSTAPIVSSLAFVHFTDTHLIDAQSPARVEFLDRYSDDGTCTDLFESSFRPQETLTTQVSEAMNRRVQQLGGGPVTGDPFSFVICTGDNIDNQQYNETRWFIDLMDGGKTIKPNSGGSRYEGVQLASWSDPEYWHPTAGANDKFKTQYGFPNYPGLLDDAIKSFSSTGVGIPWWQTYGNHDGLMQGNVNRNVALNAIAVGPLKVIGLPPGANPCNPFAAFPDAPSRPVTADPKRRTLRRSEYIQEHFNTKTNPGPVGHGFKQSNLETGLAYYVRDEHAGFRFISLDTCNPGGYADGSIGATQFAWLEQRLIEVSSAYYDANGDLVSTGNQDRLVVLFSHHGLRSLNNPNILPNPFDPGSNDLPRIMADEVETLVHRFPNVIAWVNGHTHDNIVESQPDPSGRTPGFWDICTAAHVDWPEQSRIIEIAIRADGNISIFCTMLDHAAPIGTSGSGLLQLAAVSRELSANDPQKGLNGDGAGQVEDRNVELTLPGPPGISARRAARKVLSRT